jgi:hypothetical protein
MRLLIILSATVVMGTILAGAGQCAETGSTSTPDVARLIDQLRDNYGWRTAAVELARIGPSTIPALSSVLDRKDDAVAKKGAITALYRIATRESASAIRKGLKDPDSDVKAVALTSLVGLGIRKHVIDRMEQWDYASRFLFDESADSRGVAADALFRMDRVKSVPLLLEALDREFKKPREKRGAWHKPDALAYGYDDRVIHSCKGWLGVAPENCIPTIEAYIGKGNKDMDYCLAEILIRRDRTRIHKELLIEGATKCSSPITRDSIIYQLWQVDDPRVEGILKDALNDPYNPKSDGTTSFGRKYPIRMSAESSLKKLEMKRQGRDPVAEELAELQKLADEANKRNAQQRNSPPSPSEQK